MAGKTPATFYKMRELSIFIDESGDFGEYDYHSPYYIIAMVMHDQAYEMDEQLIKLEKELQYIGYPNHCVHAGPIIRQEQEYRFESIEIRQKILKKMMSFLRQIDIKCKTVYIEKKHIADEVEAAGKLAKALSRFLRNNMSFFASYDVVKIYYDNGQIELNKILSSVFNVLFDNVEFRKVIPSDYRLFQVADLVCTLQLIELKYENHVLSNSEKRFFENDRTLKKNYIKPLMQTMMEG